MILLLRPFQPVPVIRLPVTLRQCTSIQSRLFHASPVTAARKPAGAVVKPSTASTTRKQHRKDQSDKPSPIQPPTTSKTPNLALPTTTKPRESTLPASDRSPISRPLAPKSAQPTPLPYVPDGPARRDFLQKLAASPTPTLLYESTKHPVYVTWCFSAAGFLGLISNMHFGHFSQDVARDMYATAGVSLFAGLIWAACTVYICYGPVSIVKRILAVPQPTETEPKLLFEPVRFMFGKYPKPFEVPLNGVFTDRGFEAEINKFEAQRDRRRKPGILDGFFNFVRDVYGANVKLFSRATTFAQIRIPELNKTWKVDLRDCKALDGGKTLDKLIPRDHAEPNFLTKVFRR